MSTLLYKDLMRKGDQESEMGSLAANDQDMVAAANHFTKAKEYWRQAAAIQGSDHAKEKVTALKIFN